MSPGGCSRDAKAARIDPVLPCVVTDKADAAVNVLQDLRNGVLGLASMDHCKHGVASLEKLLHEVRVDRGVVGKPASAHHPEDAQAVGLRGGKDVEGQGRSVLSPVNDVFL